MDGGLAGIGAAFEGTSAAKAWLRNRAGINANRAFIVISICLGYSAVAGSMIVVTREILLAGNPPSSACRLTNDSSAA